MTPTTTMVTCNVSGLDDQDRARLVRDLNQTLATLSDLAAAYKQADWNVVGADFSQLHALFDQLAEQTREFADVVAERAVTLGGAARGTIQASVEQSALPPFPLDERCKQHLLDALAGRIDVLESDLRQAIHATEREPVTQDVYVEVTRGIEKQRWMLRAHLANRE